MLNKSLNSNFHSGVLEFINFASSQARYMDGNKIRCPCQQCSNKKFVTIEDVEYHLVIKGFVADYYVWNHHGEEELSHYVYNQ